MNSPKYSQYNQENILRIGYFERGLSKIIKNYNFIFDLRPVSLYGDYCENEKGPGARCRSFVRLLNIYKSFLSMRQFDELPLVIQKDTINNLWKPFMTS